MATEAVQSLREIHLPLPVAFAFEGTIAAELQVAVLQQPDTEQMVCPDYSQSVDGNQVHAGLVAALDEKLDPNWTLGFEAVSFPFGSALSLRRRILNSPKMLPVTAPSS
jgi:hypothetical protein